MSNRWLLPLLPLALTLVVRADGPADNQVDKVRPVPPPGVSVPDADRKALEDGVDRIGQADRCSARLTQGEAGLAGPVAGCADL